MEVGNLGFLRGSWLGRGKLRSIIPLGLYGGTQEPFNFDSGAEVLLGLWAHGWCGRVLTRPSLQLPGVSSCAQRHQHLE